MGSISLPDREVIQIFWNVKKKIQMEFGVKLQLSQPDIKEQLEQYVARSKSDQLKGLVSTLVSSLDVVAPADEPSSLADQEEVKGGEGVRYYRGQPIA